jgi:hypothetical protein
MARMRREETSNTTLYLPVEDEEEEEEDGVGRFLRRCWRCGMPRCTDR